MHSKSLASGSILKIINKLHWLKNKSVFDKVLLEFNLQPENHTITNLNEGLINITWIVENITNGKKIVLQKINEKIFTSPADIAFNIRSIGDYLASNFPDFLFTYPVKNKYGKDLVKNDEGWFRAFDFIEGSHTLKTVETSSQAYEAAKLFGKFTNNLSGFEPSSLRITLPDFHNLGFRFQQFRESLVNGNQSRIRSSQNEINYLLSQKYILDKFNSVVPHLVTRVTHHDTKISNVLFDNNNKGLCVIDLDTIMPGYFISDVGDMMRTYICPYNEEEKNFTDIYIRKDYYLAIKEGYSTEIGTALNYHECKLFHFAGQFMIYMQALRFLTDHFNNDKYYLTKYLGQNYIRARNQVTLLQKFNELQNL